MKILKVALILSAICLQNVVARRIETDVFIKQVQDDIVNTLEKNIKALEEARDFKVPEGSTLAPLSNNEKESLSKEIAKLKAAANILHS